MAQEGLRGRQGPAPGGDYRIGGARRLFDEIDEPVADLATQVRDRFEALHGLHRDEREHAYRELLASAEYLRLKQRMDAWCALWFWPAGNDSLPLPHDWKALGAEAAETVESLAAQHRFFHWEVEFPDVFRPDRKGFDAVLGNPPWEITKLNSQEFFSRHDPLYRTYGKVEALAKQTQLCETVDGLERDWAAYQAYFKAMANLVKGVADPFDVSLARGSETKRLAGGWELARRKRSSLAHRDHPYRLQHSADLNSYKMFLEASHHLLADGGRLGMLVPSGIYTDKGTTDLRGCFLDHCSWEWCYGFENRLGLFPIHRSFKFVPIVVARGGTTTDLNAAFMRHDVREWERPGEQAIRLTVKDIRRFSPATRSFMEFKTKPDLDLVERIYADHSLVGQVVRRLGGDYTRELHMTGHARHFASRTQLESAGVLAEKDDARDPRVRARLSVAGYVPLYEGKSFWLNDPYFSRGTNESVSKFVRRATASSLVEDDDWRQSRLVFRNVASSTNQRTLIVALMPPTVHGHSAGSLGDLGAHKEGLTAILGSIVLDYVCRMKVSANLSWFHIEALPVAASADGLLLKRACDLVHRLNAVGAEFPESATVPITAPANRLEAHLMLDALVANLYTLHPDDVTHIASRFPIYDKEAPASYRYATLAVEVFKALHADGPDAAERRAAELAAARSAAGVGFGLDALWQPDGGWERANVEAHEILGEAEAA